VRLTPRIPYKSPIFSIDYTVCLGQNTEMRIGLSLED
jgi:hypothetical protein